MSNPYEPPQTPPPIPAQNQALGDQVGMRLLLPVGRSGWAIAAGYLGLFAFVIIPAPLAFIVSIIAIWHIRQNRGSEKPKHGMGRAVFGLITGLLGTVALIVILVTMR